MNVSPKVTAAQKAFVVIILEGVPILLRDNATSFLSFMCCVSAIDALAAYRYLSGSVERRFCDFISAYFPSEYGSHSKNLYGFRNRVLHNFTPANFSLVHSQPRIHLTPSQIGDVYLDDGAFFSALRTAAVKFFREVAVDQVRHDDMLSRLENPKNGGEIYA